MKPVEQTYGAKFFARRSGFAWRRGPICEAIIRHIDPRSVIDVGCAIGDIVEGFSERGLIAMGIEGSADSLEFSMCPKQHFIVDLRKPLVADTSFDLVTCFEVAEHIEPEYADIFMDNLVKLSRCILFSFAPPGSGGIGHVNCQEPSYWDAKFRARHYACFQGIANDIKAELDPWRKKDGIKAFFNHHLTYYEYVK